MRRADLHKDTHTSRTHCHSRSAVSSFHYQTHAFAPLTYPPPPQPAAYQTGQTMECMDEWTRPEVPGMPDHEAKLLVPISPAWLLDEFFEPGLENSAKVRSPVVCVR